MKLRTQLFLGYLLVFSLMLVTVAVSYRCFSSHADTTRRVVHTLEVVSSVHLVEKLLSDMETGQRGLAPGAIVNATVTSTPRDVSSGSRRDRRRDHPRADRAVPRNAF